VVLCVADPTWLRSMQIGPRTPFSFSHPAASLAYWCWSGHKTALQSISRQLYKASTR
jgi:hypothetical protein